MDSQTSSALVVVDMQNDFAHPDGSLFVSGADEVVAEVNSHIIGAVASGRRVVYTRDWHPESTPHFEKDGGIWPVHCVANSWGAAFHDRLVIAGPEVRKGVNGEDGYSGFTMRDPETGDEAPTGLLDLLGDVQSVSVVGLALDYCVKATALDARLHSLEVTLPRAATAAVEMSSGDGERAIEELEEAGVAIE